MARSFTVFLAFILFTQNFILASTPQVEVVTSASLREPSVILPREIYYDWQIAMNESLNFIYDVVSPNPVVGSVGGEWAILALARSGRIDSDSDLVINWLYDLENILLEVDRLEGQGFDIQNPPSAGTFPSSMRRWTDFQRVTIALSSLGIDATDFNGRDLTAIYSSFVPVDERHALNMTVNVDTFALIALDTNSYEGDRDYFIDNLLYSQTNNGTWALGNFNLDVTIMAAQALAPYYHGDREVRRAINRSLRWLRTRDFIDPESTSQMIVLLTALGQAYSAEQNYRRLAEDFLEEASYYVEWLLRWFDEERGAFRRSIDSNSINQMSTEQAAYALVAYYRFRNNMTHLYDMSDMFEVYDIYDLEI